MNWRFWTKKGKSGCQVDIVQLREQLTQIGEHVHKVARIQYKTGQDVQNKLERLSMGMDALQQWQDAHDVDRARLNMLESQIEHIAASLIHWLDDIDSVSSRLQGEGQDTWRQLLHQWTGEILAALAENGIRELDALGRSFDPRWAEAISTEARPPELVYTSDGGKVRSLVPYQVMEVVKRGFINSDGRLLRKAQVITLREGTAGDYSVTPGSADHPLSCINRRAGKCHCGRRCACSSRCYA